MKRAFPLRLLVILGLLAAAGIILLLAGGVRLYGHPSAGMSPTVMENDRMVAARLGKTAVELPRGTLVVYDASKVSTSFSGIHLKRLVALPGDRIEVMDAALRLNGEPFPVIDGKSPGPAGFRGTMVYPLTVPPGRVFVLGDNYGNSLDSRHFGTIPAEAIIKTVKFRVWPLSRFGVVR